MLPTTTDVLIVGGGPAGLTAACTLAARGHAVSVVDRQAAGANTSRAAVVHARTLEVLEGVGVAEALVAEGIRAATFVLRDHNRVIARMGFGDLPTRYPYALMVSQATTERLLLRRFEELGGHVHRPYALKSLTADGEAALEGGVVLHATWVVGADGMHSTVREQAGIGFAGGTYEDEFTLGDVQLESNLPRDEVSLFFSPEGLTVVAPLPGGRFRIVTTGSGGTPDVAFFQRVMEERGVSGAQVSGLVWSSKFRVHHRVADRFRSGRVLLAGDAAHVHSPAGGQGMNLGIRDAYALGSALSSVLEGGPTAVLDAYASEQRSIAREVVGFTDRLTRLAVLGGRLSPVRNLGISTATRLPVVRRRLTRRLSGLVYR